MAQGAVRRNGQAASSRFGLRREAEGPAAYSTVTDFARLRGWSTSFPMKTAVW